ncbi:MAG TPA: hypothetical protein VM821_06260 [Abditibacteriaceae bacterium]|jgi:hypothetical protein|nr:hypothetical protein [Abditibacteriaceae bacterium]
MGTSEKVKDAIGAKGSHAQNFKQPLLSGIQTIRPGMQSGAIV